MWKIIEFVTACEPHDVILIANLIFLLSTVLLTYWASKRLFDERTALLTVALVITNPVLLYFACTTGLYVYDAAFSAFLVLLLLVPPQRFKVVLYFLFGLFGAFRLSSFILTFPVVFVALCIRYARSKDITSFTSNSFAIVGGIAVWFIPFLIVVRGWDKFIGILMESASLPTTFTQNLSTFLPFHLWMLNVLLILIAFNQKNIRSKFRNLSEKYILLIVLIAVPGLFFCLKYYAKGYALLYLVPITLLGARLILKTHRRNLWAFLAISTNLALFFFAPFKEPSVRSWLNHSSRSIQERWETALWRATSYYAPTLAHLHINDCMMAISKPLLDSIAPESSYVIVDASAAAWAFPRSLQVMYPQTVFLLPHTEDSIYFECFSNDSINDSFELPPLSRPINLYYLSTTALRNEMGKPPGILLHQNGTFMLYTEPNSSRDSLRHYINALFYRGTS